jgi:hypothetical protein
MAGHSPVGMPDRETEERIARNEATFREANERIESIAATHSLDGGAIPFICECADPACTTLIHLTLRAYRDVRTNARQFVVATGHESSSGTSSAIVERRDGFMVVEKQGLAGEIAEEIADG